MIRKSLLWGAMAVGLIAASSAPAKIYKDYAPGKGVWNISAITVDPNHLDEYLTGLRRSDVPGFEIMKRRGLIDNYWMMTRNGYSANTPNVLIGVHYVNAQAMAPDQARDQAIEKEIDATMSEEEGKAAIAGYEKYRKFVDTGDWTTVDFAK